MTTPTATRPADLAQLNAAAERASAEAQKASVAASAAMAEAQLAAERIHRETDIRFVRWAEGRLAEAPATEQRLAGEVDHARQAFERAVAAGDADFVARYLSWATAGAALYHHRSHLMSVRGNLHFRRPDKHPAADTGRGVTHDSRVSVPGFADALARAADHAVAARGGDVEDALQAELQAAIRGESPATPDRRDA